MKYGILDSKGFISLIGDVGTGKNTLVNALANSLGDNIIFARIADPALGQVDFINLTADAFKMKKKFSTKRDFLGHLKVFLNVAKLSKKLKQENHKGEVLSSELSSKVDLIAELQEKLENSQTNALKAETKIENSNKKINALQENLLNLKKEKASTETQFGQLKASYAGLNADIQELKGAKDRVAELERATAVRAQTLTQTEQQVEDLTAALEQEKKGGEQLRNELSTKADRVAELEQKLTAALTRRAELENDVKIGNSKVAEFQQKLQASQTDQQVLQAAIDKREKEIAVLQNQLKGFEAQQIPVEPSPGVAEMPKKTAPPRDVVKDQSLPPNPSHIIDWVLKKKAK